MPPLARMVVPALEDLARQLRFAPREALLRDIERAEGLASTLRGESFYDEAWIVERVTGYQPEIDSPATIVGSALLSDLSAFVERLSESARLTAADLPAGWLDPDALSARWNISRKTLDRYRKRGLVARRILGADTRVRLAFTPSVVGAFEARQPGAIERASEFSRISPADEARIVRRAARYRRRFNCTLNEAARRLAARFDRSLEAVRQVLKRHEQATPAVERIFTEPGPPDARFERLAWRAWSRALDPGLLAARSGRSRVSVVRAINHHRALLLRAAVASFDADQLEHARSMLVSLPPRDVDAILSSQPVTTGLGEPGVAEALAWIDSARRAGAPLGVEERCRAQAYHVLLARVASITDSLGVSIPEAEQLDQGETLLRWSARLKVELIRAHQGLLLRALESRLGHRLEEVRAADLSALVRLGIAAIAGAIDTHEAFGATGRGAKLPGRLAAPAGLAIDRAVARWIKDHGQANPGRARATPRLSTGAVLPEWTRSVCAWQAWVEPDPRVRAASALLPQADREFLCVRYGWSGSPPATLDAIAPRFGLTRIAVVRHEREVVRSALAAARALTIA